MSKKVKISLNKTEDMMKFVRIVNTYHSDIDMYKGSIVVDAKDIDSIRSLDLSQSVEVAINADDTINENSFLNAMMQFVA